MKYLKKTLSFVLSLAMVFTMVIVPRTGVAEAADDTTTDTTKYTYFDTTMFKYDTDKFNETTQLLEPKKINDTALTSTTGQIANVLIVSEGYALKSDGTGVEFDSIKNLDSVDSSLLWTISGDSNGSRYIKNQSTGKYLNITTSGISIVDEDEKQSNIYVSSSYVYIRSGNYYYVKGGSSFTVSSNRTTTNLYKAVSQKQGIYFNDGSSTTTILGESINNSAHNKWTGKNGKAVIDLVDHELDSNNQIVFNNPQAGIFDTSTTIGKSYYTNVEMPFKTDSEGYYYYDSSKYDVKFPNNNPAKNTKLVDCGISNINNSGDNPSFLPFASGNHYTIGYTNGKLTSVIDDTDSTNNKNVNISDIYHFGMNMSVKFYMTQDGLIDGDTNKPMKFEFSGDDDVWVFVDGKLVLDIGGIHDSLSADINFATGDANVYKAKSTTVERTNNIYTDIFKTNATTWRQDEEKVHTLQVFYLERGAGLSNCKIRFNLLQKDKLEITKSLGNNATDDADLKALLTQKFKFEIYSSTDGINYSKYANKEYYIYESGNYTGKKGTTGPDGNFELGFNQTALFKGADLSKGYYYKVNEIVPDDAKYTSTWQTSKTFNGTTSTSNSTEATEAVIQTENNNDRYKIGNYKFTFINTFEPTLNDDLVVLDYGKPVKIDVLKNDVLYGSTRKIKSIKINNCTNGNLQLVDDSTQLKYTPTKYMNSVDTAVYDVNLDGLKTPVTKEANVYIMPATSVYYEDDFADDSNTDPTKGIVWSTNGEETDWVIDTDIYVDGDEGDTPTKEEEYQSSENSRYGWDPIYEGDTSYSDVTAHATDVPGATATFKFTGTGVDIYTKTDMTTGKVLATLTKDGETVATKFLAVDNKAASGEYYQIPTLFFENLDYATYQVKIKVLDPIDDKDAEGNEITRGTYYLDGIRVYNPLGIAPEDPIVKNAYGDEYNATFKTVRQLLLDAETFTAGEINNGAVFIDEIVNKNSYGSTTSSIEETTTDIGTYDTYGPKNEVYLEKGQSIAFKINSGYKKLFVGAKSIEGKSTTMKITDDDSATEYTFNHTADMYYEVNAKDATDRKNKVVVITNTGDGLLSITKIRATGEGYTMSITSDDETVEEAKAFSLLKASSSEDTGIEEGDQDTDVDIDNPSDNDKPSDDNNTDNASNDKQNVAKKILNLLLQAIKAWFER